MLPKTGPVETFAQLRAALDKPAFLEALGGGCVFIRLDERGGEDEPAPWAFHGSGLPLPVDVPSSEGDVDVFLDREITDSGKHIKVAADDSTITGPTFSLSIPAARGRATLHVVPLAATVTIGRDATCGVRVNERSVSREHAKLSVDTSKGGRAFSITDAGGKNRIAVNGKSVAPGTAKAIKSGDVVDLGDVSLLFLDAIDLYDGLPRLTSG